MRFFKALPLTAALASAFVLPEESVMNQIAIEDRRPIGYLDNVKNALSDAVDSTRDTIDSVIEDARQYTDDKTAEAEDWLSEFKDARENDLEYIKDKAEEAEDWFAEFRDARQEDLESFKEEVTEDALQQHWHDMQTTAREWADDLGLNYHCEHNGPPVRGGPDKYRRPYGDNPRSPFPPGPPGPPHDERDGHHPRPPHKGPPHRDPHHKPNKTVYELISNSKYTTKLTKLIDQFPDVVEMLNGTKSNFTIFAPTDKAFEGIPEHGRHASKEVLLKILQYHVVPDVYPAGRVLGARTLPTVLEGTGLSVKPKKTPQRISVQLSFRGLTLNHYSRIIAINIAGTNGIVHGINSILVPPPKAATVIEFLPAQFSTLELALFKTGLFPALNDTSNHLGGTVFAPSNPAWAKLGDGTVAFLFSKYGNKYLKALVKYHVSPNITLYSDALYVAKKCKKEDTSAQRTFHVDLPTLLEDKYLSIDIGHLGRFYDMRINGFSHVAVGDVAVRDGVIQVVGDVLIPPKSPGQHSENWSSGISVEELVERLEPYVEKDDVYEDELALEL